MVSAPEIGALPKILPPEPIPHPINRLPEDIFVLIPYYFESENGDPDTFSTNKSLITMTHVCRSWRSALLSTPDLWTQLDFSVSESKQAECFLARSGNQLLDVYQSVDTADNINPFLPVTLRNTHRLRRLDIACYHEHVEDILAQLTKPAPELKHLTIANDPRFREDVGFRVGDAKLPNTIFGGQFPKLATLSLKSVYMDLHNLNLPSLTGFSFRTAVDVPVQDLTFFFRRCPSLEFINFHLSGSSRPPIAPPRNRVCLAALKELRLGHLPCTSGLINHLILPLCAEVMLQGQFTVEERNDFGGPAAQIHPSSIDHLPVTRGITKAVAMPNSCILSGPNGNLRFWFSTRASFDAGFFTSLYPISVSEIKELWVGHKDARPLQEIRVWDPTVAEVYGVFEVLTKVEDLAIVSCKPGSFLSALVVVADDRIPLPTLRRLTVFVGQWGLDVPALIQCAKTRKEHSRPLGQVTIVFEEPKAEFIEGVELLREFVGESVFRVGATPRLSWMGEDRELR